jgi:hypothetical protein
MFLFIHGIFALCQERRPYKVLNLHFFFFPSVIRQNCVAIIVLSVGTPVLCRCTLFGAARVI